MSFAEQCSATVARVIPFTRTLCLSAYTVHDHLKAIFAKTGVSRRGELVGRVFLEHYASRWEDTGNPSAGWFRRGLVAAAVPEPAQAATATVAAEGRWLRLGSG